jgi:putative membrane protein
MVGYARRLAAGDRRLSGKTLRILNEVPGIAAVLIVVLAIVKPF